MRYQKSADTKIIESVLAEAKIGETVSYAALSQAIGRDVLTYGKGAIYSARKSLLSEKRMVFECIQNVGYVRLDDSKIVRSVEADRKSMHRKAQRTLTKLACVEFEKLNDEEKKDHVAYSAQIGTLAMFSNKASVKRIAEHVKDVGKTIAIGETIKMFS